MDKNVFLTEDILIKDWESDNIDRYEYTENKDSFIEYIDGASDEDGEPVKREELEAMTMDELKEKYPSYHDAWRDSASYEEQYEIPMMNALRYFPDFVSFEEADRYKTVGCTTLLYDNELEAWAVGMPGGGMNLAPDLLATFINLGKGVPIELAEGISANYSGNVRDEIHAENCRLLARAYFNKGMAYIANGLNLNPKMADENFKRHFKGLQAIQLKD